MAIDSKEKRVGVLGVGRPWLRDHFPLATPDEQWRMGVGNAYGGNALSPAASHVITIDFTTAISGESTDGTRKVIATITPGDASVVYVFEETEVS